MRHGKWIVFFLIMLSFAGALGVFGWHWYDSHADRSGWSVDNEKTVYLDFRGNPISGWLEQDGNRYYLDESAGMVTGWAEIDGERFNFDESGVLRKGWLAQPEGLYYLDGSGNPVTGWQSLSDQTYYFLENGTAATSWLELDGARYFFDEKGCMVTGWLELPEGRYYLSADGILCTGFLLQKEGMFYLDDNGRMCTGWVELSDGRHYFAPTMRTGWQEIDGKLYCFDSSGVMLTGWIDRDEYRYYLTENGAATGPVEIDGEIYHFTPKGICVLLVNYNHRLTQDYVPELIHLRDNYWIAEIVEPHLREMIRDCEETGIYCTINCCYRSYESQQQLVNWQYTIPYTAAQPGQSEHQTGLSVDIVCSGETGWLQEHCWEYGFILRYPVQKQEITRISGEFWHFRYVGREVSMDMKDSGLCLEEYLGAA